jgi:hypothetical protein
MTAPSLQICNNHIIFFQDMLDQLRAIFDQIIKFQATQDTLFSRALFELELRKKKTDEIKENTEEVGGDRVINLIF